MFRRQSTDAGHEEMEVETNRLRRELNARCRELEAEKQVRARREGILGGCGCRPHIWPLSVCVSFPVFPPCFPPLSPGCGYRKSLTMNRQHRTQNKWSGSGG